MATDHDTNPIPASPSSPIAAGTTEILLDGGFEDGQAPSGGSGYSGTSGAWQWTTSDGVLNPVWTDQPGATTKGPRTGAWCVYFDPLGPVTSTISQQVSIPSGATGSLSYWLRIGTYETTRYSAYDTLTVSLVDSSGALLRTLASYSNLDATSGFSYVQHSFDVSAYSGKTVKLRFNAYNDSTNPTLFLLDDVSLLATASGGGGDCGDSSMLCLDGNRFRISVTFTDYSNATNAARAVPLTSDTGYFWFSSASNVEVFVKVLDFCSVNGKYAVYGAGATDLGVSIRVLDFNTGQVKTYTNPLGRDFQLVKDAPFSCVQTPFGRASTP